MPCSRVTVQNLNEMEKVKCIRTDNKLYFGQIDNKKKHGQGTWFCSVGISIYKEGKIYEG